MIPGNPNPLTQPCKRPISKMALHVGTLKLSVTGTESICITILQDDQVYCLSSAVCFTPYLNRFEDAMERIDRILHDDALSCEVTDIRKLLECRTIRPGQKFGRNDNLTSCKDSGRDRLEDTKYGQKQALEMTGVRDVGLNSVESNLTENYCELILEEENEWAENEKNLWSLSNCENIFCQRMNIVTNSDCIPYCKTRVDEDPPCFYSESDHPSPRYDLQTNSANAGMPKHLAKENIEGRIVVKPCHIYKIPGAEQTLRRIFRTQDFKINNSDRRENELFFQLASTVVIFGK